MDPNQAHAEQYFEDAEFQEYEGYEEGEYADYPQDGEPRRLLWVFALLLVTFALFAPSVGNDFTWDDRWAAMGDNGVAKHPLVSELQPISTYFTSHYWPHKTDVGHAYRPVTVLSFALRHAVFGDSARAAHMINVLLHLGAVALVLALLMGLGMPFAASCAGALVFGAHAIHSEVVASITGRSELLAFVFGASATLLLARARSAGAKAFAIHYPAALVLLFLAFGSKESALAWAVFAPLYLAARSWSGWENWPWRGPELVGTAMALLVPAAIFLGLRFNMLAHLPGSEDPTIGYLENPLLEATFGTRLLTGLLTWGYGLWLTLCPFDLAVDYGPGQLPVVSSLGETAAIGSGLALLAIGAMLFVAFRRRLWDPPLFLAVACFLGFSFIVTNIPVPVFMMFAERSYYTPSLGLALVVGWAATRIPYWSDVKPMLQVAMGAWVGACSLVILERNGVWKNDETLVMHELHEHPNSVRMQLCAGEMFASRGDLGRALQHYRTAADLDPLAPQPWIEIARLEQARGNAEAVSDALAKLQHTRARDTRILQPSIDAIRAHRGGASAASPR